jgi:signal transduction histidine kinase
MKKEMTFCVSCFGVVLVIGLAGISLGRNRLIHHIRERDKTEDALRSRTVELEKANKELRQVPARLIATQEEERKRIAAELHDSIGQTFAAVKFWIEMTLEYRSAGDGSAAFNRLEQLVPTLQQAIQETRSICMGLRPPMLDGTGLLTALEWLRQECMKFYPSRHIELETGITEEEIPQNLKPTIFRIVQEALNNVGKHSNADWVDISVSKDDGGIALVVSDDGIGLDMGMVLQNGADKTLGLTTMRERTELLGGSFTIESASGGGTTIRAWWPGTASA